MANEFVARKGIISLDSIQVTGSISATGGIIISGSIASASYASNAELLDGRDSTIFATTGSNIFSGNQTICANLTTTCTITAQTLVVQTVTSSIVYSSGSNIFGNQLTDTQRFTGSMFITGSTLNVAGGTICTTGNTCFGGMSIISSCLGIGASNPVKTLDVRGTLAISNSPTSYWYMDRDDSDGRFKILDDANSEKFTIATSGDMYLTGRSTSSNYAMYFYSSDSDSRIYSSNSSAISKPLLFYTSGSERMRITSDGAVGIGTNSPAFFVSIQQCNNAGLTNISLDNSGAIPASAGTQGTIFRFRSRIDDANIRTTGAIASYAMKTTGATVNNNGDLRFYTGGEGDIYERMRLASTGVACFACTVSIGAASTSTEANLFLGAQGTSEGGQLVLQKGTSYNCATHLDNYQNQFRIISGTDTVSSTVDFSVAHTNGQAFVRGNLLLNATTISNSTNTFGASANGAYQYFSGNLANGEKFGSTAGTYIQGFYLISWVSASGRGYAIFATVSPAANAGTALISSGGWATVSATYNAASAISLAFDGNTRGPILSNNTGVTTTFYAYVFGGV